jgi:hypothetical protein
VRGEIYGRESRRQFLVLNNIFCPLNCYRDFRYWVWISSDKIITFVLMARLFSYWLDYGFDDLAENLGFQIRKNLKNLETIQVSNPTSPRQISHPPP